VSAVVQLTVAEFHAAIQAQGAPTREDITVICPMCECHQTARDLIEAGAGTTFEAVEPYLGFSCVGRWLDAASPRNKPDGKPCNWTLGGLFKLHTLEVVTPDGKAHPRFAVAEVAKARKGAK
jgi:hypothetical protein